MNDESIQQQAMENKENKRILYITYLVCLALSTVIDFINFKVKTGSEILSVWIKIQLCLNLLHILWHFFEKVHLTA